MAVGRIHAPKHAEEILASGSADLVVMGRPLLADPELPRKAQQGRFEEIRRCISCQNCVDTLILMDMNCAVNASSGRELQLAVEPAAIRKKVLVVELSKRKTFTVRPPERNFIANFFVKQTRSDFACVAYGNIKSIRAKAAYRNWNFSCMSD